MDVAELLRYAVERRASDVHLTAGNVPFIRVDGELLPAPFPVLSATDTRAAAELAHAAAQGARSSRGRRRRTSPTRSRASRGSA